MEYSRSFFEQDGPLATMAGYECRPQQQEMADAVWETLDQGHVALIEAGTGTGKSLAYLYPAVCYAVSHGEKVVVSTNTLNLQDQLLNKDLPILRTLGLEFGAVVVKGWANYPCWQRTNEALQNVSASSEQRHLASLVEALREGRLSRSELPIVSNDCWEDIRAEADLCLRTKCEFYDECPVFRARKQAEQADLIIVNHHLLLADVSVRQDVGWEDSAVLPLYHHVVFDEAHHLQDVATEYFGVRVSQVRVRRLLSAFYRPQGAERGGLVLALRERLVKETGQEVRRALRIIDGEMLPVIRDVDEAASGFFAALAACLAGHKEADGALRLSLVSGLDDDHVLSQYQRFVELLSTWEHVLHKFSRSLQDLEDALGKSWGPTIGLHPYIERVKGLLADVTFLMDVDDAGYVYWLKALPGQGGALLQAAPIEVGSSLKENLLFPLKSAVFTSATLTVDQDFTYYRRGIGLDEQERWDLRTLIYASPFDYQKQVFCGVPSDLPYPGSQGFAAELVSALQELLPVTDGRAFVLFTSYQMLRTVAQQVRAASSSDGYNLLVQGELPRERMVEQFQTRPRSVLLGTSSFWEGVDVAGDALSLLVITKLPFPVPTEPVAAARAERIALEGGNAFIEYFLPQAVIKFRQGFGRLIRTKRDRGIILVCDRRLVEKRYGQQFLQSLPVCEFRSEPIGRLKQEGITWLLSSER